MKKILITGMLFMVLIWLAGGCFRGHRCTMVGCGRAAALGSSHCRLHQDTFCVQAAPAGAQEAEAVSSGCPEETLMAFAEER